MECIGIGAISDTFSHTWLKRGLRMRRTISTFNMWNCKSGPKTNAPAIAVILSNGLISESWL